MTLQLWPRHEQPNVRYRQVLHA